MRKKEKSKSGKTNGRMGCNFRSMVLLATVVVLAVFVAVVTLLVVVGKFILLCCRITFIPNKRPHPGWLAFDWTKGNTPKPFPSSPILCRALICFPSSSFQERLRFFFLCIGPRIILFYLFVILVVQSPCFSLLARQNWVSPLVWFTVQHVWSFSCECFFHITYYYYFYYFFP